MFTLAQDFIIICTSDIWEDIETPCTVAKSRLPVFASFEGSVPSDKFIQGTPRQSSDDQAAVCRKPTKRKRGELYELVLCGFDLGPTRNLRWGSSDSGSFDSW